jgi:hypothetical protein
MTTMTTITTIATNCSTNSSPNNATDKGEGRPKDMPPNRFSISIGPVQYNNYRDFSTIGLNLIRMGTIGIGSTDSDKVTAEFPQIMIREAQDFLIGYNTQFDGYRYPTISVPQIVYQRELFPYYNFISFADNMFVWASQNNNGTFTLASMDRGMNEFQAPDKETFVFPSGWGGYSGYEYSCSHSVQVENNSKWFQLNLLNFEWTLYDMVDSLDTKVERCGAFFDLGYERLSFNNTLRLFINEKRNFYGNESDVNRNYDDYFDVTFNRDTIRSTIGLSLDLHTHDVPMLIDYAKIKFGVQHRYKRYSEIRNCTVDYQKNSFYIFAAVDFAALDMELFRIKHK